MSERTPDTSNSLAENAEPSMEDILASIRKIIADDEGNEVPLDVSDALAVTVLDENVPSNLDAQENLTLNKNTVSNNVETLDLDVDTDTVEPSDSEIDALIADMDMIDTETLAVNNEVLELESDMNAELEIPMEEESLKSLEEVDLVASPLSEAETVDTALVDDASDEDLSTLLDDMLHGNNDSSESDTLENLELVVDPAEALLNDDFEVDADSSPETQADDISADSDIDLVKSLMADLTGAPLHDELNVTENSAADPAVSPASDSEQDLFDSLGFDIDKDHEEMAEYSDAGSIETLEAEADSETDDIMDEILSLTMDDEVEIQAEAVKATGVEVPLSLKDIAAQAELDADAMSTGKALAAVAALGAVAQAVQNDAHSIDLELESEQDFEIEIEDKLLDVAESNDFDDVDEVLAKLDDIVTITPEINENTDLNPEEENTPMPRALKTDTIIDEVTETATADVFSSLNKVVEEKAVVAERGDRIGDLVMESLRPMLKDWLDANLKGIVERAVTKEVKRISSGK